MIFRKQLGRVLSVVLALTVLIGSLGLLTNAADDVYLTSDDRSATEVTVADDYDFVSLGTNLAYDSTVSKFNDDGTGTMVYDETNGMKRANGSTGIFQTSGSRTADQSGVVKYSSTNTQMLKIAPNMDTKSYYLITYFIKCDTTSGTNVRHYYNTTTWANFELTANYSTDWQRVTYIYYTGNKTTNECAIGLYNSTSVWVDDFAVYKLTPAVGGESCKAGTLLTADDAKYTASDDRSATKVTVADDYDFASLGTNLAYDSTVSKFNDDGTGAMVYDETNGMKRANGSTGIFQTSDSRTADQSGVVKYSSTNTQMLKIAPNMDTKSYYLITYFIKCDTADGTNVRHYYNTTTWANIELDSNYSTDWQRVSYIYYTGNKTTNECAVGLYNNTTVYLDDFAVYKLSSTVGGKSTEAGQLISPDDIKYTASDDRGVKKITVTGNYDFASLGTNLAYDSTVSKFTSDGTTYDTAAGIKILYDEGKVTFASNAQNSHTADESGAVYLAKGQPALKIADTLATKSYYLITFFAKNDEASGNNVRHWFGNWDYDGGEIEGGNASTSWNRITYIVYTGNKTSLSAIGLYTTTPMWLDDFAVYKLGSAFGGKTYEAGQLIGEGSDDDDIVDTLPDERELTVVTIDDDYDFTDSKLSANLASDSTVSKFLSDGTTYDTTNGISVRYDENKVTFSSAEEASHEQDGSGAVYCDKGQPALQIAPTLDAKSYYLVTYFVKNDGKSFNNIRHWYANWDAVEIDGGNESESWKRISYIVYTGKNTSQATVAFFTNVPMWLDDFAVYKLDNDYGAQCVEAEKLLQKTSEAILTPNVDGYDYNKENNLVTDGSFEESGVTNSAAKFGSKVFSVTAENAKITLPKLAFTRYYLVSYYVRTNNFATSDKVSATFTNEDGNVAMLETKATNDSWKLVTAIINSGDHSDINIVFDTTVLASGKDIYIDGLSVHALPDKVAQAAEIIDAYKEGVLNSTIKDAKDVFGAEGEYNTQYKIWRGLISPVKSTDTENVTYASLFNKYYKDYDRQDKISRGFAPSGFGFRRQFSDYTSDPAYNLIKNAACDDATYWADSTGFLSITSDEKYEGNTSLKVSGEGLFVKKLDVKPNTVYYLTLRGMGYSDTIVPHIHFGIMDMNFLPFENPKTNYETSDPSRDAASKQEVTIKYPDGTWYRRTYQFNTGDNSEVYFFIKGVKGESYFDAIEIFEAAKSKPRNESATVESVDTTNDDETRFACDEKYNLIPNGMFDKGTEFWKNFNGINEFVEVVTSEGNKMLHYKGARWGYFYLPTIKLEANKTYTFSFWYRTLNGQYAKFGISAAKNPRSFITAPREITNNRGEWTLCSITFKTFEESEISLAIYDNDGEAVFDKVRLFESKNGYELSLEEDMPKGGLTFSDTVLGTDGLVELEDEEFDEEIIEDESFFEDDFFEEEEDGEETEENTTKVIRKYKKKPSAIRIATWFIILVIVVAVVVLAGVTFLM